MGRRYLEIRGVKVDGRGRRYADVTSDEAEAAGMSVLVPLVLVKGEPKREKPNWRAECCGSYIANGIDADGKWYVKSDAPFKVYRRRGIKWEHPSKRARGGE